MGTSLKKVAKKAKDYKYVLLVMRHAKTEPFGDGGDAGRELTDKGRKQAKAVAKGLAAHKMVPTRIACSSATRARHSPCALCSLTMCSLLGIRNEFCSYFSLQRINLNFFRFFEIAVITLNNYLDR